MLPRRVRTPFSLYRKNSRHGPDVWYVRFWDENAQKFSKTRSTGVLVVGKRQRRPEADAVARDLLASINFTPKPKGPLFLDYVEAFWTPESSYVREKALVAKKPLTNAYVKMSRESLILHARPFARFQGLLLTDLNAGHIRDWVQWKAEAGLGPRWINATLQTMRVAVRQAFQREELPKDPFEFVRPATDWPKAKGILNQTEACGLGEVRLNDRREPLAVMLAALCGLGAVKSRTCPGATSAVPQTLSMSSTTM